MFCLPKERKLGTRSSKIEGSTDVQTFIKQIILINGSLSSIDQKILVTLPCPCPPYRYEWFVGGHMYVFRVLFVFHLFIFLSFCPS